MSTAQNRKIGSIEHVGPDGFIVFAADASDPEFYGGKRLFSNFDKLLRFLSEYLRVPKGDGASYGTQLSSAINGGNGITQIEREA